MGIHTSSIKNILNTGKTSVRFNFLNGFHFLNALAPDCPTTQVIAFNKPAEVEDSQYQLNSAQPLSYSKTPGEKLTPAPW